MAGGLVAEQQVGPLGERAGDRDPLALAAGELGRQGSSFAARPTSAEQLVAPGRPEPRRRPRAAAKATFS